MVFPFRVKRKSALGITRLKINPTRIFVSPVSVLKFQVAMSGVQQPSLIENLDIFLAFHDSRNNFNGICHIPAYAVDRIDTAQNGRRQRIPCT